MLKMFSTQLTGLFKRILEKEEFGFEDAARLLAQAAVGDGSIIIKGFGEMAGIEAEAFQGAEPFPGAAPFQEGEKGFSESDRFLLFTRNPDDAEAARMAEQLRNLDIPFAAVSSGKEPGILSELADVHIQIPLEKGLLPDERGNRVGLPFLMAGLFAYYGIKFTLEEILQEYQES